MWTGPGVRINGEPINPAFGVWRQIESSADLESHSLEIALLGTITPGRYFKLGLALSLYSGLPYTMNTGRDDNHDGFANDRPGWDWTPSMFSTASTTRASWAI